MHIVKLAPTAANHSNRHTIVCVHVKCITSNAIHMTSLKTHCISSTALSVGWSFVRLVGRKQNKSNQTKPNENAADTKHLIRKCKKKENLHTIFDWIAMRSHIHILYARCMLYIIDQLLNFVLFETQFIVTKMYQTKSATFDLINLKIDSIGMVTNTVALTDCQTLTKVFQSTFMSGNVPRTCMYIKLVLFVFVCFVSSA